MNLIRAFVVVVMLVNFSHVNAEAHSATEPGSVASFQNVKQVMVPEITVPTVVEVSFRDDLGLRKDFLVREREGDTYLPWYFKQSAGVIKTPLTVTTSSGDGNLLIDEDLNTSLDFALPEDREGVAHITITSAKPVSASSFYVEFAENVAPPIGVEVRAKTGNSTETILVSDRPLMGNRIVFPKTTADTWMVTYRYVQPLRISELSLNENNPTSRTEEGLRFLAQPNHSYEVYYNPDQRANVPTFFGEEGDLISNEGVVALTFIEGTPNAAHIPLDSDGDGVLDSTDNCVDSKNADQLDTDHNMRGDTCDDFDRDGIRNAEDNCVNLPNYAQEDTDMDGIGNACDAEESRFTERHKWVEWAGVGVAAIVLVALFALVALRSREEIVVADGQKPQA